MSAFQNQVKTMTRKGSFNRKTYPIGSMYAIYGNIYHQYTPNVSIYTIHGSYGYGTIISGDFRLSIHDEFHGFSTPRIVQARGTAHRTLPAVATQAASVSDYSAQPATTMHQYLVANYPLSKWVITPTLLIPFITGVITHLLSGMSHQVGMRISSPKYIERHQLF